MFVRQAANVIDLLEYFAERQRPATLAEIADDLGWPRSSTFNLVNTLVAKGYMYEPRARGGFYPSLWWQRVANSIADAEPLPAAIERLAKEVALRTGETASIVAPSGTASILIYSVESHQPIRYSSWVGQRNMIHASASGRALLTQFSPTERQALYRKIDFQRYTPTTPASPEEVEAAIKAGIARGYHLSEGEVTEDVAGIGVPLAVKGRILSIVVAGPMSRCMPKVDELGRILREAVAALPKDWA